MNYTQLITQGIKNLRLKHDYTQEQFAEKIDMSVQGYRNIEQGKYLPTAKTIDSICSKFNINPIDLLVSDSTGTAKELQDIIAAKVRTCSLEKLIKINKIIDIL
jgi:DNA-binding XRE family transcriptional regulator